jgi:hypothetical protein
MPPLGLMLWTGRCKHLLNRARKLGLVGDCCLVQFVMSRHQLRMDAICLALVRGYFVKGSGIGSRCFQWASYSVHDGGSCEVSALMQPHSARAPAAIHFPMGSFTEH